MQTGGLIIVAAGGEKVLFSFKQKSPGDHVDNDVILNALGITSPAAEPAAEGGAEGETKGECDTAGDEGKATPEGENADGEGETAGDEGKATPEGEKADNEKTEAEGEKAAPEEESCAPSGGGSC